MQETRQNIILSLIGLMFFLASCDQGKTLDELRTHVYITKVVEKSERPFPGGQLVPAGIRQQIEASKTLREVFPVTRFIRLEATGHSLLGNITGVAYSGNSWFVSENTRQLVYQFDDDGTFIRVVGARGKGPGEYGDVYRIGMCYGNLLGIQARSGIFLFDEGGRFIKKISLRTDEYHVVSSSGFIWKRPERLYLANFASHNPEAPWHAVVDPSAEKLRIVAGFGERINFVEKATLRGAARWNYTSFARVGDRIWTGSPYEGRVEVFDLDGRYAGELGRKHPEQLTLKDFEGVDMAKEGQIGPLYFDKFRNAGIIAVGDLAVASLFGKGHFSHDIFDRNGNLLCAGITAAVPYALLHTGHENLLVGSLHLLDSPATYERILTEGEMTLLYAAGWDPATYLDDNPYLVVGRSIAAPRDPADTGP